MKKTYIKPSTEEIKLETTKILCGSEIPGWDNLLG